MACNSDGEEEQCTTLVNIMFGNINERGETEADFLDEESRKHLSSLEKLGMGQMVQELTEDDKDEDGTAEKGDMGEKSPSAVDFFDITDSVPDEDSGNFSMDTHRHSQDSDADDEEDYSDRKLMPPPSWAPRTAGGQDGSADKKEDSSTPLRKMLPPEYSNIDVTEIFPAFKKGKVLRFSRLFKPIHKPVIYRKKKKKVNTEARDQTTLGRKRRRSRDSSESGSSSDEESDFELDFGCSAMTEEMMTDDEELLMRPVESKLGGGKQDNRGEGDSQVEVAPWRYGPAQYWYDKCGVDEKGEDFDYGFKLKKADAEEEIPPDPSIPPIEFSDEVFLMVVQRNWEEDIIWSGDDAKHKVLQSQKQKAGAAGWIPSTNTRTAGQFSQLGKASTPSPMVQRQPSQPQMPRPPQSTEPQNNSDGTWYSIFPCDNYELCYGNWEDDIIWDAENMETIPKPKVMTLDLNDENIILGIPEDRDPNSPQEPQKKEKETKKTRFVLGKHGLVKEEEEEEKEEMPSAVQPKDLFNISNDEFYNPRIMDSSLRPNIGNFVFQHSTPAVELVQPFFPTHMGEHKMRTFHRYALKRYSHGALATPGPHPVQPLHKLIKRKAKQREQERQQTGGGETFFMRTVGDLSGMDGDLVLTEYTEEYPPLTMQIGMATKIKNYYKRKPGKDVNPPQYQYGELAYAHTSPFLGVLRPGECQPALENNMFRAPIYQQTIPPTDFVIIRTRHGYFIRDVDTIFCVGQEHPLMEVPGPNSKSANIFARDFLQVFIYRLFRKSKDEPKRIKMEDIRKAFPTYSESSIRKRLKLCADFKRTGMDSNWWVQKPEFRLPTEEEIRNMVSPEQCCAYYSFITAEQRLKDAGYGDTKNLFAPEDENEEETQSKMDDEVRAAPWNTTRAFIAAMKGKCLLQLSGPADPTGCGEGFSYVKVPNKPQLKEETQTPIKKTVTGTDADLRRLNLKDARNILRKFGLSESHIKNLSRWQVINVVREISTSHSKAIQEGEEMDDKGWSKFARGNKYSTAEHYTRYKEDCQKIFDLQSRILSSKECLSTDDESSSANDSDIEEMGKDIETMITNKKTSMQLSREKEEAERRELQKLIRGEMSDKGKDKKGKAISRHDDECSMQSSTSQQGTRRLIIKRTFKDDQGHTYTREEIVRKADVLDTYMRIRQTKDPSFIKQFAAMDDQQKEEMRKERRRIQEQLRRIKRNQEKPQAPPPPKKKKKEAPPLKMKCGACGQIGHMRTNKECPMYAQGTKAPSVQVAMTEEQQEEEEEKLLPEDQNLINVDGTKLIVSKNLAVHAATLRRKSLVLKVPKQAVESKKKRRLGSAYHCDYLKKPRQSSNRRRTDPLVSLSTIFDNILKEVRTLPASGPFLKPVNTKDVPDYYKVVKEPMDLQTIREKNRAKKYESREQFLNDINQIHENSLVYNGERHTVTAMGRQILDFCLGKVAQKEAKLMRLEKAINPLLDDDDQVAFSYIMGDIVNKMKAVEGSWPFQLPVNKKNVKDYYEVIKNPMDLSTLNKNVKQFKYYTRDQFLEDVELIYTNSMAYNGVDSTYTATARTIMQVCKDALQEREEQLVVLETELVAAHEAALDGMESESIMTGTSLNQDSITGGDESYLEGDTNGYQEDETMDDQARGPGESDNEFVDIEGYDDNAMDMNYGQHSQDQEQQEEAMQADDEDELAKDLQVTDEEDGGEDLQAEEMLERQQMEEGELQQYDYQYAEGEGGELMEGEGDYYMQEEAGPSVVQDEDENSFDPTQFFLSSTLAQATEEAQAEAAQHVDINSDLQVSESEDEGEDQDQQQYSDQGFDLDQYLQ